MSELVPDPVTPEEDATDLQPWLGYGVAAALTTGALGATSSALALGGAAAGPVGPAEVAGLLALIPLGVVAAAYYRLARHLAATGLARSAVGLCGLFVLLELAALNVTEAAPRWWNVVGWLLLATVGGLLLWYVFDQVSFAPAGEEPAPPPAEPETPAAESTASAEPAAETKPASGDEPEGKSGSSIGAVVGGVAALGGCLWKVGTKLAAVRLLKRLGADGIEAVVLIALLVLVVAFLVWFAVVKIRLRHRLGGFAAAAGLGELAVLFAGCGLAAGAVLDVAEVMGAGGPNAEAAAADAVATWTERAEWVSLAAAVVWAALTAAVFRGYQSRLAGGGDGAGPDGEYRADGPQAG